MKQLLGRYNRMRPYCFSKDIEFVVIRQSKKYVHLVTILTSSPLGTCCGGMVEARLALWDRKVQALPICFP